MITISKLAIRFGLSRSTLLYYDRIGLLKPSNRSRANYRSYADADVERLEKIVFHRKAGLSLKTIKTILSGAEVGSLAIALERRLAELKQEIRTLRSQQQVILGLLKENRITPPNLPLNKQQWTSLLRATGLDDDEMHKWHFEFEIRLPDAHQEFLESLGLNRLETDNIRKWSLTYGNKG